MPVPTYDHFIAPLLRYLAAHPEGGTVNQATDATSEALGLTADDRAELLASGAQTVVKNRIGWAHDRLKRAGLSESPRRGFWRLTAKGREYATAHDFNHASLSTEEVMGLAQVDRTMRLRDAGARSTDREIIAPTAAEKASPEDRIEVALAELRESVARDLLESIAQAPPAFFEQLVLDLLHAMGYGISRAALQRVGGGGDGGIDGIISLDRLGLEKVYIQAKRWTSNNVGSPEIQGFMGALQLQGASKGVFLTTSDFTKEARQAAERARGSIVLVDGARLSMLMIDHGVGVSHRALKIPKVDGDYFEQS